MRKIPIIIFGTVILSCFFFSFSSCQSPTTTGEERAWAPLGPGQINGAKGAVPEQLIFPIWWVLPGYQTGGSEIVVVFSSDQQIYTRDKRNTPLTNAGTWKYDQDTQEFTLNTDTPIYLANSSSTEKWDGVVHYGNRNLLSGTPDFTEKNIPGKWHATSGVEVYAPQGWTTVNLAKADLEGGEIRLAVGDNDSCANLTLSYITSIVPETWTISPMGDEVKIVGGKGGGLCIEYHDVNLVLVAQYYENVQGLVTIPPATQPDIWLFGGLKATLTPMQGPT